MRKFWIFDQNLGLKPSKGVSLFFCQKSEILKLFFLKKRSLEKLFGDVLLGKKCHSTREKCRLVNG